MNVLHCIAGDLIHAADQRGGRLPDVWRVGHSTYKELIREIREQAKIHQNGKIWVADNDYVDTDHPHPRSIMVMGVLVEEIRSYGEDARTSEETRL